MIAGPKLGLEPSEASLQESNEKGPRWSLTERVAHSLSLDLAPSRLINSLCFQQQALNAYRVCYVNWGCCVPHEGSIPAIMM